VGDVAAATIAAADRGTGVINVGGGSPASLNEALRHIGELAGAPVPVVPSARPRSHVAGTWADTARARELLGWTPSVGLREGLERQLTALRESGGSPAAVARWAVASTGWRAPA
jgi:UDP-glucuronate 4-epimerase